MMSSMIFFLLCNQLTPTAMVSPRLINFTRNIMLSPETQTADQYRDHHHHHHLPVNTTDETADVYSNRRGHNNYAYTHSNYDDENSLPNEICQDEENERGERVVNQRAEYSMNTTGYAQDDDEVLSPRGRTAEGGANASTGLRVGGSAIYLRLSHINDDINETSIWGISMHYKKDFFNEIKNSERRNLKNILLLIFDVILFLINCC